MQTNVEDLGALERRLNVSVPQDTIEMEVESRLKRLARTAKLHGFRPGKVPLKVVAQQYGPQVRQEVIEDTLKRSFSETVRERNLRIAGYPRFEPMLPADGTTDLEFSATFEVYPDIVLGDLSGARLERPVVQVTGSDVDNTLEVLRKQRIEFDPAQRSAQRGDRITIDYSGVIDGAEFAGGKAENFSLILGEGRLLKDFEEPIAGMTPGQSKTIEVTFPADYHGKEVAGKTATFTVKVSGVDAPKLPDVDSEFAKSLGVADGDIEKMRNEIQANLEREVNKRVKGRLKDQVMQTLLNATDASPPRVLVENELERLTQEARHDLAARGLSAKNLSLPQDVLQERAQHRVKLGLILGEMVKAHGLHPTPEQVRTIVEDLAQSYENPAEVIKWHYSAPERLGDAEALALEDNVVGWALEKVTVADKTMTLDELMGRPGHDTAI